MKFLVVGCGSIGLRHIRNLKDLGYDDILAYKTSDKNIEIVRDELKVDVFHDYEKALNEQPDMVVIANPTSLHVETALKAIKHNCHVFMEKPLSCNLVNVDPLLHEFEKREKQLIIGNTLRFNKCLRHIKSLLGSGEIGKPISIRSQVGQYLPDWHPWEDYRLGYYGRADLGGGPILTLMHELDYNYWILGEIDSVFCFSDRVSNLEISTDDVSEIIMRFSNKVLGEVHMDYIQRHPSRSCQIIGDEGTILWDDNENSVNLFTAKGGKWKEYKLPTDYDRNQMYVEEIKNAIYAVEGKEEPMSCGKDGKYVLGVALAAIKSSETNKLVKI